MCQNSKSFKKYGIFSITDYYSIWMFPATPNDHNRSFPCRLLFILMKIKFCIVVIITFVCLPFLLNGYYFFLLRNLVRDTPLWIWIPPDDQLPEGAQTSETVMSYIYYWCVYIYTYLYSCTSTVVQVESYSFQEEWFTDGIAYLYLPICIPATDINSQVNYPHVTIPLLFNSNGTLDTLYVIR